MISIFPDSDTDSGLGNPSSKITFEAFTKDFTSLDKIKKPVVPNKLGYDEYYFGGA